MKLSGRHAAVKELVRTRIAIQIRRRWRGLQRTFPVAFIPLPASRSWRTDALFRSPPLDVGVGGEEDSFGMALPHSRAAGTGSPRMPFDRTDLGGMCRPVREGGPRLPFEHDVRDIRVPSRFRG